MTFSTSNCKLPILDLAVGAPYEGDGAVYIFHGSPSGLKTDFSQRIYTSDLPSASPLKTFGYSLSGGEDLDYIWIS